MKLRRRVKKQEVPEAVEELVTHQQMSTRELFKKKKTLRIEVEKIASRTNVAHVQLLEGDL